MQLKIKNQRLEAPQEKATNRYGLRFSFEKALLFLVFSFVWASIIVLGKLMPHYSAAILSLSVMVLYGIMISVAHFHHRRKMAKNLCLIPTSDYHPFVTIVIPAHNEAFVIADTVKTMMSLDYDNYELWVIDDRSTDGTRAVLTQLAKTYPGKFHFMTRPETAVPGKSAVLNDALAMTQGDVILVFDADGRVEPDFLTRALPYLSDAKVGAVQARKVIMNRSANYLTRCQYHEYLMDSHFQAGRDIIRGAVELRGNGQLVKRKALEDVEGWTESTITDDLDLSTKLHLKGWDVRFLADITVHEEGITRFRALLRQRRRWAEGSLKRYLEYAVGMVSSPYVSWRAQMDMLAYFAEFIFPVWFVSDCLMQGLMLFTEHGPTHLMSSLFALPALGFFFLGGIYASIRHYERASVWHALWGAIETALFLTVLWVPVVYLICSKVLLTRDKGPLNWGKTEHLGNQPHKRRRLHHHIQRLIRRVNPGGNSEAF